ncbi:MAG: DUF4364 family protein [Oscillospiraceae bacterium]
MKNDALTAGVFPGGLTSRAEIRILICYILMNIDKPVPRRELTELLHFNGIANYFEVAFAMGDLEENNHISVVGKNSDNLYMVTKSGINIAKTLEKNVPLTIREYSCKLVEKMISRLKNEKENKVSIEEKPNGCLISCSVMEGESELMTVRLLVPDIHCAEVVKNAFLDDPTSVFVGINDVLLRELDKKQD